jgi:hypothetical protein
MLTFDHEFRTPHPDQRSGKSAGRPLNRDQLWQGLLHRVENPVPFLPGLESCTILERQAATLLREAGFRPGGDPHDRVTLVTIEPALVSSEERFSTSSLPRPTPAAA